MTISSNVRKVGPFTGTGTVSAFTFNFKVFQASDLYVVRANSANEETVLVLNSDYTVSLNADQNASPGGTVTLSAPLAIGYTMIISSTLSNLQPTDLTNQGGFYPSVITDALDRATIQIQQLQGLVDRAAKVPITSEYSVDQLSSDLIRLADSADNIDAVAGDLTNVDTVAGDIDSVVIAAENVADINNFADVYQGGKATPPTTRNDGTALQNGDLYFNTVASQMFVRSGANWVSITNYTAIVDRFDGTGAQTAFTLSAAPPDENNTQIFISGVYQQKNTYSVSGSTLTFDTAPPSGTGNIEVVVFSPLIMGAATDAAVVQYTAGGTGAVITNVQAELRKQFRTSNYSTFAQAATAAAGNTLIVDSSVAISADTTVTVSMVVEKPGMFTVASGKTLTISGPFTAGLFQLFSGAGSVVFGAGSVTDVYPEWFGAVGDGVTNDTNAVSKTIASGALNIAYSQEYLINDCITITMQGQKHVGCGAAALVRDGSLATSAMLTASNVDGIEFKGLTFKVAANTENSQDGFFIDLSSCDNVRIINNTFDSSIPGATINKESLFSHVTSAYCEDLLIDGNTFKYSLGNCCGAADYSKRTIITNNFFYNNVDTSVGAWTTAVDAVISNNTFLRDDYSTAYNGVMIDCAGAQNVNITGNNIIGNSIGVRIATNMTYNSSYINITGNTIQNQYKSSSEPATCIKVYNSLTNSTISTSIQSNFIKTVSGGYGINMISTSNTAVLYQKITNNYFTGTGQALWIQGLTNTGHHTFVNGNNKFSEEVGALVGTARVSEANPDGGPQLVFERAVNLVSGIFSPVTYTTASTILSVYLERGYYGTTINYGTLTSNPAVNDSETIFGLSIQKTPAASNTTVQLTWAINTPGTYTITFNPNTGFSTEIKSLWVTRIL